MRSRSRSNSSREYDWAVEPRRAWSIRFASVMSTMRWGSHLNEKQSVVSVRACGRQSR